MKEITTSEAQLDRILEFFPRNEVRINALFGVDTLVVAVRR